MKKLILVLVLLLSILSVGCSSKDNITADNSNTNVG